MFNHVPDLAWLTPAKLRPKFMRMLATCTRQCTAEEKCARCGVNAVLKQAPMFTPHDVESWGTRFNHMTQAEADANLPTQLLLPKPHPPQAATFELPSICKLPATSQLPAPVEHSQYVLESKGKFSVAGLQKMLTQYKKGASTKPATETVDQDHQDTPVSICSEMKLNDHELLIGRRHTSLRYSRGGGCVERPFHWRTASCRSLGRRQP